MTLHTQQPHTSSIAATAPSLPLLIPALLRFCVVKGNVDTYVILAPCGLYGGFPPTFDSGCACAVPMCMYTPPWHLPPWPLLLKKSQHASAHPRPVCVRMCEKKGVTLVYDAYTHHVFYILPPMIYQVDTGHNTAVYGSTQDQPGKQKKHYVTYAASMHSNCSIHSCIPTWLIAPPLPLPTRCDLPLAPPREGLCF